VFVSTEMRNISAVRFYRGENKLLLVEMVIITIRDNSSTGVTTNVSIQ